MTLPAPSLHEENAQLEALAREARALIEEFMRSHDSSSMDSPEGQALTNRIFQIFLSQSVRFPDPTLFCDWLEQDVALDNPSATTIVQDIVTLYADGSYLLDLIRTAVKEDAEHAKNAIQEWLESHGCDDMVHRSSGRSDDALKNSPFYHLVESMLTGSAGIRAQMVAVCDMYCETGWAEKDWATILQGPEEKLSPGLKAWVMVMQNPASTPEAKVKAFEQRIQELLVDVRISDRFAGDQAENLYLASTGKKTRFSFSGKIWGNGAVGLVMPFANDETRLMVAEVTAQNARLDPAVRGRLIRIFASIRGALLHGNLSGKTQEGFPVDYKSAVYRSYVSPLIVAPEDDSRRDEMKEALGLNTKGMHALNTLLLLMDGHSKNASPFPFDTILMVSLKLLGAVSHWKNMENFSPDERLTKACEVMVDAAKALVQIGESGPHLKGKDMMRRPHGKTIVAVQALHLAIEGAMASSHFQASHHDLLRCIEPSMKKLLPLLEETSQWDAAGALEKDLAMIQDPWTPRKTKDLFQQGELQRKAYSQEQQQNTTRKAFQELVKTPPFKGYKVNGQDHFIPSDVDSIAGALDQIASSTAPEIHRWVENHAHDLSHLGMDQVKQWAALIVAKEGPADRRPWATLPPATADLNRTMAALNKAWGHADLMDEAQASSSLKALIGARFVEHLHTGLNWGIEHFDTLPERMQQIQHVIQARHLDTVEGPRQALKDRLIQIAGACPDLEAVRALCDHLKQPFEHQGIPFNQLLGEGKYKNDPLALPQVMGHATLDPDDLHAWTQRASKPVTPAVAGVRPF